MDEQTPAAPPAPKSTILKDWKKYLVEFIMIFLAVFLGFLAENLREEFADREHAEELARSLYEELRNDSIAVKARIEGRIKKEKAIEYMVPFFRDSSLNSRSKALSINFIWAVTARTPIIFTPRTVVLEQLRSSGSLRYFKNKELQTLIGDLSVAIDYIKARQEYENAIFETYMEPIMARHMDYNFQFKLFDKTIFERLAEYEKSQEYIPFQLSQQEKINRAEIMNALSYYHTNGLKSTRLIPFEQYVRINAATLQELRKEYNLK